MGVKRRISKRQYMKLITIHIPKPLDETIVKLVESGFYSSRSELIRIAIEHYVNHHILPVARARIKIYGSKMMA